MCIYVSGCTNMFQSFIAVTVPLCQPQPLTPTPCLLQSHTIWGNKAINMWLRQIRNKLQINLLQVPSCVRSPHICHCEINIPLVCISVCLWWTRLLCLSWIFWLTWLTSGVWRLEETVMASLMDTAGSWSMPLPVWRLYSTCPVLPQFIVLHVTAQTRAHMLYPAILQRHSSMKWSRDTMLNNFPQFQCHGST